MLLRIGNPPASSEAALKRMKSTRKRDTTPEVDLRRALHRLGFRYRIQIAPIPGLRRIADVVFPSARLAVYVDGCFWPGMVVRSTPPGPKRTRFFGARRSKPTASAIRTRTAGW